jgi:hypothetical protein
VATHVYQDLLLTSHVLAVVLLERRRVRATQRPLVASPDGRGGKRKADPVDPRDGHREDRRGEDRRRIRRLQHQLGRAQRALSVFHVRSGGPSSGGTSGGFTETEALAAAKSAADSLVHEAVLARSRELEQELERERDRLHDSEENLRLQRFRGRGVRAALTDALAAARCELAVARGGSPGRLGSGAGQLSDGSLAAMASLELEEARRESREWAVELIVERHRSADLRIALDRALTELHVRRTREGFDAARAVRGDGPDDVLAWDDVLQGLAAPADDGQQLVDSSLPLADMLGRMRPRHVREAEALIRVRLDEGRSGVGSIGEAALALLEERQPGYLDRMTAQELGTVLAERAAVDEDRSWSGPPPVDPTLLAAMMVRLRPMHELEASQILEARSDFAMGRYPGMPVVGGPSYPDAQRVAQGSGGGGARGRRRGRAGSRVMSQPEGGMRRSIRLSSQPC